MLIAEFSPESSAAANVIVAAASESFFIATLAYEVASPLTSMLKINTLKKSGFHLRLMIYGLLLLLAVFFIPNAALPVEAADTFQESVFVSGLTTPTSMEFAPDGRLFVAEQRGTLRVIKNNALLATPFVTLSVNSSGERGLLGLAFDPNFNSNHFIYLYYTTSASPVHNRVSRFTANGDVVVSGSELVLLDLENLNATNHNGGAIHFGLDGKLYIAVGENANSSNSQNLATRLGKILRINSDGSIPSDNPFVATPGARPEIWAYGFRNPFSFAVDPPSGAIYLNDVGEVTWEEVNVLTKGANYGWPTCEGPQNTGVGSCTSSALTYPIYYYNHNGSGGAITGGTFYRGSQFPASYLGSYFLADYVKSFIQRLDTNNQGSTFWTAQSPVDLKVGPDGLLYYASIGNGNIYRLSYVTPANSPPSAVISANPSTGQAPLIVSFSASGSTDPNGDSLTYAWNFGDSTTGSGLTINHTYQSSGPYTATLTVSDGKGGSDAKTASITVGTAPVATILTPSNGLLYNAGDTISYSGSGTDAEDGTLAASKFSWTIVFHHNTHTHPFLGPVTGSKTGTFQIPTTGEVSADSWYRIHLTVTDSTGLTHEVTRDITPRKVTMTLNTNVAGLSLTLDGQPLTTPITSDGVIGFQRDIGAAAFQAVNGSSYAFSSWSDGGAATHTITTPSANTTYTATYVPVASTPYSGTPAAIPGTIQAENFDNGGEGVAYHDTDTGNNGSQYRSTDVDIKTSSDTGTSPAVGWMNAGEWLKYSVNVANTGNYDIAARVASAYAGKSFHVEFDGADKTGALVVPNTGAWDTSWATITKTNVALTSGQHIMRIFSDTDLFDLNYLTLTQVSAVAGDLNLDHIINSLDWSYMNSKWFTTDSTSDINHDGIVNAIDFSILNNNWFKTW